MPHSRKGRRSEKVSQAAGKYYRGLIVSDTRTPRGYELCIFIPTPTVRLRLGTQCQGAKRCPALEGTECARRKKTATKPLEFTPPALLRRVSSLGLGLPGFRFQACALRFWIESTSTKAEVEQAQPYPGSLEHDTIGLSSS